MARVVLLTGSHCVAGAALVLDTHMLCLAKCWDASVPYGRRSWAGILKAFAFLPCGATVALEKSKALISSGSFLVPSVMEFMSGMDFNQC